MRIEQRRQGLERFKGLSCVSYGDLSRSDAFLIWDAKIGGAVDGFMPRPRRVDFGCKSSLRVSDQLHFGRCDYLVDRFCGLLYGVRRDRKHGPRSPEAVGVR